MAFNNWPYTNFQDLNLGWILAKVKEALTGSAAAMAKAEAVETEVGTYSDRISDAEAEADSARSIANTARSEALNAQSDATSGIAIGQAAQSTANSALSAANAAADSADEAVDSATDAARDAATALQLANLASEDYLNVGITVFPSNPAQATKNADEILTAVTANKKIKFTLDDARNGETHTTYDYTIDPVDKTASDIDINVIFDVSVSSSLNKYIVVTLHKVVSGGNTTYSITSTDVSFSGGGGGSGSDMTQIPITSSGGVYSTTMTATELLNHLRTNGCFAVVNGVYYVPVGGDFSGPFGDIYFQSVAQSDIEKTDIEVLKFYMHGADAIVITAYSRDIPLLTAPPIVDTATGDPASITDGANHYPLKSLIANIDPVQSGSGDPSPSNVRPITGWTTIRITKAITVDSGYCDITLPSEAGIVYGGTLDVINGILTVDKTIVDMGTLSWTYYETQQRFVAQVNNGKPSGVGLGLDGACSCYKVFLGSGYNAMPDKSIIIGSNFISNNFAAMVVRDSGYTDLEAFKASVRGQMLVYPIRTPSTYNVSTLALKTALGRNDFSADSGAVTVEYYADTKLYIQKLVATNANNEPA